MSCIFIAHRTHDEQDACMYIRRYGSMRLWFLATCILRRYISGCRSALRTLGYSDDLWCMITCGDASLAMSMSRMCFVEQFRIWACRCL